IASARDKREMLQRRRFRGNAGVDRRPRECGCLAMSFLRKPNPVGESDVEPRERALIAVRKEQAAFLTTMARRMCRNQADADDLVQDTLEVFVRASFRCPPGNPDAWLAVVMHNQFIDRCRARARAPLCDQLDAAEVAAAPENDPEPPWAYLTLA